MYHRKFFGLVFPALFFLIAVSAQSNSNGTIDSSRFNGTVNNIVTQRDGKIVACGNFITYNKIASRCIARLNADGSLDKSFVVGAGFNTEVNAILVQPDGKIIAGGQFNNYNGTANPCNKIVRLNSDGSIDKSFNIGTGFRNEVNALALQPDGKIIVGGVLANYNGIACGGLVRLNANGSLDQNFVYIKGISGYVYCISLMPNGKIIAGGYFGRYDKTPSFSLAKLNSDGTLDNSFVVNKGFGSGSVLAVVAFSNGKVMVGGNFNTYNNSLCHNLTRLNSDGGIDNSFAASGIPTKEYSDYGVYTLVALPDGKILIGGKFDYYNTTLQQSIARLNADGSIDNSFGSGTGFDNETRGGALVKTIALTANGNIIAAGSYKRYDAQPRKNITELDKNGKLLKTFTP